MVASRRSDEVVDPTVETRPSTRALKRALLTALRCVDPDSEKRPKMGQVVRMLESDDPIPRGVCILYDNKIKMILVYFMPVHVQSCYLSKISSEILYV